MEKVNWKVEGMSCTNCALSIDKYLRKEGMQQVKVNFIGGDVSFEHETLIPKEKLEKGIRSLGYTIKKDEDTSGHGHGHDHDHHFTGLFPFRNHLQRFWFVLFLLPR